MAAWKPWTAGAALPTWETAVCLQAEAAECWSNSPEPPIETDGGVETADSWRGSPEPPVETGGWSDSLEPPAETGAGPAGAGTSA